MQLYFIRHAQSENNLLWHRTGSSIGRSEDPELTTVGCQQAHALAQYLCSAPQNTVTESRDSQNVTGFGITHLYSSLMVRSVATGTIVARTLDLPLVAWEDLHERGGIYARDEQTDERTGVPGRNRAYFQAHYPDFVLPGSLDDAGWWNRPYEEPEQWRVRAQRFMHDLLARHGGTEDRVAVVSHAGFYNEFLAILLAMPQSDGYWFILNNAAITRIDFHVEWIDLVYMNRADFLHPDLVT
jgi:2,3-bisphosphoglycerate-dependent phosphoglycerate mutase